MSGINGTMLKAISYFLANSIIFLRMLHIRLFWWEPFIHGTKTPQNVQQKLLRRILQKNKTTGFGQEYRFSEITSYTDFVAGVPVHHYEDLRPYIETQEQEKRRTLNSDQPLMYAQTSGTTGKPKYVPILKHTISEYRKSQALASYAQYKDIPSIYHGKILAIVSPAIEGYLETTTPYGSMSGLIYKSMPMLVRAKYIVPPEIFEITEYEKKYKLIAAYALAEKNITLFATANPVTFLKVFETLQNHYSELLLMLDNTNRYKETDGHEQPKVTTRRLNELKQWQGKENELTFNILWPAIKAVVVWTDGNAQLLIPQLKSLLPEKTRIVEMGYLSSEFRGSITIDVLRNQSIPAYHENFYEFVEKNDWEDERPVFKTLEQLKPHTQYYVIVTTQSGLYRYFMNDLIEVTDLYNQTPVIRFLQKGKGATNLTGEKLYESQLIQAIDAIKTDFNLKFEFFIMVANRANLQYSLLIEHHALEVPILEAFERQLCALNIEFNEKRKSGRLKPTLLVPLSPGTGEAYKQHALKNGQREGQYKVITLQYADECTFDFIRYQINPPVSAS